MQVAILKHCEQVRSVPEHKAAAGGHAHWLPDSQQRLREAWPTTRLCLRGLKGEEHLGHDQRLSLLCSVRHLPNIYSVAML